MIRTRAQSLPVAMYHYVNQLEGSITVSPARFEEHCRALADKGFRGVGLEEAEAFLIDGEPLPARSFLFTFDDGFFDNYVHAQPILRKYGHRGVVFAVSDRLEAEGRARVAVDDALQGNAPSMPAVDVPLEKSAQGFSLRKDVFLNHAETRLMHEAGVLSVASHSRGHYGVYASPEYTDLFKPRSIGRTFYRTEDEPVFGLPEFPVKPGLANRAFLPAPELVDAVRSFVPQDFDQAAAFFADRANENALRDKLRAFSGRLGRFETDAERRERMWREIDGGKQELEAVLGVKVRSLCWPWGAYDQEALQMARDAGFELFFTTREGVNPPARPLAVHRFKAKDNSGAWLASRARIYSRPLLGALYAGMRI